ncbi:hypothetical protein E2C01_032434 [Portunus trituberculatus]|uniref:Uncharacterized protein n=1 Tax=Portunus trituberculatus TaxID=210409 RepID=A0A5B7F0Q5_PORTR|nr:hypothetical protein [Portunus trituberculatus]
MKVRMRSQVAVEEIMARKGKLAHDTEYKDIWIKRDMNLEEREKEKVLRSEAKKKNEKRTEIEKKNFYWRVLDMRLQKWYIKKEVLWLEVTVDDALGVEVVKCLYHTGCVEPGGLVIKVTSVPAIINDNIG